jgi:hypothetical protein
MNIKNSKIDFKNQKKFLKRLAVTTMLTAITCGYFENAAAEFNANVSAMFREAIDCPSLIDAHTTPPTEEELITCNVHLANTLANAIANPLAFLISNGDADPVPATPDAMRKAADFVTAAPAPGGAQPRGAAGAWGLVDPARAYDTIVAALNVPPGDIAPRAAEGNIPQHIIDAKKAVAVLIVASAKAAKAAGAGALGLNASAIRAAAVYDALPKETTDAPCSNADAIVAAYLGVPGAAAVRAAGGLPADDHDPAKKLWDYMIGYARLWKIPANLNDTQTDINYLIWCRAAHVGDSQQTGIPGSHSSFIVPPDASFSSHFSTILNVINRASSTVLSAPIPTAIRVSWKNTLNGMPPPDNSPTLATDFHVNVHLDAVGAGVSQELGNAIKSNLRVAPLDFTVTKPEGWVGQGRILYRGTPPLPPEEIAAALPIGLNIEGRHDVRNCFIGTLREVAITRAALAGAALADAVPNGAFLPLLEGGAEVARVSNPQGVKTVTICVTGNGVRELFPE